MIVVFAKAGLPMPVLTKFWNTYWLIDWLTDSLQSHLLPHHRIAHINTRYKLSRKEWIANINNSYKVAKKGLYNYGHVVKWEEAVQENSPSEECTQWPPWLAHCAGMDIYKGRLITFCGPEKWKLLKREEKSLLTFPDLNNPMCSAVPEVWKEVFFWK